jgi:hypothetical protein
MTDDRVPTGVPSPQTSDDLEDNGVGPDGGGFLIEDAPQPPPDGEQLFWQAVEPEPPPAPWTPQPATPSGYSAEQTLYRPDPAGNAIMFRVFGLILVLLAPFIAADASSRGGLITAAVLFLVGLFLIFYLGSVERLRRDQVVDRWDILIDGGQGRRAEVLAGAVARIDSQGLPEIQHETRELATSYLRAETRPFLVVTHADNRRLKGYRMHVNVRDYGATLQANWYLSYHRGFFTTAASSRRCCPTRSSLSTCSTSRTCALTSASCTTASWTPSST